MRLSFAGALVRSLPFVVVVALVALACGGPRYPNCENDEQCNDDEGHHGVCVRSTCVACRDDASCAKGKECKDGACAAILGWCDDSHACTGGSGCGKDHRCGTATATASIAPVECGDDKPCPGKSHCENAHCVSPPAGGPGCTDFPAPKFEYESPELRPEAKQVLDRLVKCMSSGSLKGARVLLTGHCDARGEYEFNMSLGAQRAENVKTFLVGLGLGADKIATSSRGKLDAAGSDEAGWANDRRVDLEVR